MSTHHPTLEREAMVRYVGIYSAAGNLFLGLFLFLLSSVLLGIETIKKEEFFLNAHFFFGLGIAILLGFYLQKSHEQARKESKLLLWVCIVAYCVHTVHASTFSPNVFILLTVGYVILAILTAYVHKSLGSESSTHCKTKIISLTLLCTVLWYSSLIIPTLW